MFPTDEIRERLVRVLDHSPHIELPAATSPAAVLVPVLVSAAEPRVVFTKRTDTLSRHAGEISFPGGLADPGEDLAAAALREAEEELGLAPVDVDLLGALPAVHTRVTGMLIAPFVGLLRTDPRFTPNAAEIADVLEFRLADLLAVEEEREFEHEGRWFQTYVYELDGHVIWGATARILWSFIDHLRRAPAAKEA
jgi:8-oxo-dGTP pyrophosphatase MutT (NUDIX family)